MRIKIYMPYDRHPQIPVEIKTMIVNPVNVVSMSDLLHYKGVYYVELSLVDGGSFLITPDSAEDLEEAIG